MLACQKNIKCLLGYKMSQDIVSILQHGVISVDTWYPLTSLMWRVISPPDFLDKTGSGISPLYLDITGLLVQRCSLDILSLFLICLSSLCNPATRFVHWEKRVERTQVKSPQWAYCQTKSPCGLNWPCYISLMSISSTDPVQPGHSISYWAAIGQ